MKAEQIGIFIGKSPVDYLAGLCEVETKNHVEEKFIIFASNKTKTFKEPLKEIKSQMIKKFDSEEFKNMVKEELDIIHAYNREHKLNLPYLQILQIAYTLNRCGDLTEKSLVETINKLTNFYKENL